MKFNGRLSPRRTTAQESEIRKQLYFEKRDPADIMREHGLSRAALSRIACGPLPRRKR